MIRVNNIELECDTCVLSNTYLDNIMHESITFKLSNVTYDTLLACFQPNVEILNITRTPSFDGTNVDEFIADYSDYTLIGDIVDKRDGTFIVTMLKPTESEYLINYLTQENNDIAELVDYLVSDI